MSEEAGDLRTRAALRLIGWVNDPSQDAKRNRIRSLLLTSETGVWGNHPRGMGQYVGACPERFYALYTI